MKKGVNPLPFFRKGQESMILWFFVFLWVLERILACLGGAEREE